MENQNQAPFTADELSAEWSLLLTQYLQAKVALEKESARLTARLHQVETELLELRQSNEPQ
jgi:hypothetical protein